MKDTSLIRLMISRAVRGVPGRSIGLIGIRIVSCERPPAQHDVERSSPQRTEGAGARHQAPEALQRVAGAFGSALGVAGHEHRGVHRPGRRAGDSVDLEPRLLEETIEHAPRVRAVRASSL